MDELRIDELARDYTGTSLYQAQHAEVSALIAEANTKDVSDPYEVMKLRGKVEAFQWLLSVGFVRRCAMRALLMADQAAPKPPANPPMAEDDWRDPLLREMGALPDRPDLVS